MLYRADRLASFFPLLFCACLPVVRSPAAHPVGRSTLCLDSVRPDPGQEGPLAPSSPGCRAAWVYPAVWSSPPAPASDLASSWVTQAQEAYERGDLEALRYCLEQAPDLADDQGQTPLHWMCEEEGSAEGLRALLGWLGGYHHGQPTGQRWRWTPFELAYRARYTEAIALLLASLPEGAYDLAAYFPAGQRNINLKDSLGRTPLYWAVEQGFADLAAALLTQGADPNLPDQRQGQTPLHVACANGHTQTAQWLLEQGADLQAVNNAGATPLHVACANGHTQTAQWLLEQGAERPDQEVLARRFEEACQAGQAPYAQCLLALGVRRPTPRKLNGWFSDACAKRKIPYVQCLLVLGADPKATNRKGETAFYLACQRGHLVVVQALLEDGRVDPNQATTKSCLSRIRGKYKWVPAGTTPWGIAKLWRRTEVVECLESWGITR